MAWNLYGSETNLTLICFLIIVLSPLGRCAALRGKGTLNSERFLNMNTQERLLPGRVSDEKPDLKEQSGKLYISLNDEYLNDGVYKDPTSGSLQESDYQSDQDGWHELQHLQEPAYDTGLPNSPVVLRLLGMKPEVECAEDSMVLKISGGPAAFNSGLLIDQGNFPPVPLSNVPSGCGLDVQRAWPDVAVNVPYYACYVIQERNTYVLPLRLWGLPAKMSCPFPSVAQSPPLVSCYPNGMVIKAQNVALVENLLVKVVDQWLPVMKVSSICDYSLLFTSDGVAISAPYKPCMKAKDGVYSLHVAAEKEYKFLCPALVPGLPFSLSSQMDTEIGRAGTGASAPIKATPKEPRSTPHSPLALLWLDYTTPSMPSSVSTAPSSRPPKGQIAHPTDSSSWYAHDVPVTEGPMSTTAPSTPPHKAHQIPYDLMISGSWYPLHSPTTQENIAPSPVTPHSINEPWLDQPTASVPSSIKQSSTSSAPSSSPQNAYQRPYYSISSISHSIFHPKPRSNEPSPIPAPSISMWYPVYPTSMPTSTTQNSPSTTPSTSLQTAQMPHYPMTSGSWYPLYPSNSPINIAPSPITPHSRIKPWLDEPTASASPSIKQSSTSSAPSSSPQNTHEVPHYPTISNNWHSLYHLKPQTNEPSPISAPSIPVQSPIYPTSMPTQTTQSSPASAPSPPQKANRTPHYPMTSSSWYPLYLPKPQTTTSSLKDTHASSGKAPQLPVAPKKPKYLMLVNPSHSKTLHSDPVFKGPHPSVAHVYSPTLMPVLEHSDWQPPESPPYEPLYPKEFGPAGPFMTRGSYKCYLHQYLQRPVAFPIEPPIIPEAAWLPYQAVPETLEYLQCCPSTPLYPNCCQPPIYYHQHGHNHFGFPYPAFDPNSGIGATSNLTSPTHVINSAPSFQPVRVHTENNYEQASVAFTSQDDLKVVKRPSESSTSLYPYELPGSTRTRIPWNNFSPSREYQWGVNDHLYKSLQYAPNGRPFVHAANHPKWRPYVSAHMADYRPPYMSVSLQNGVPPFERFRSSLPFTGKYNERPFMFSHDGISALSYKDQVDPFSAQMYAQNPASVLQDKRPPAEILPSFDSMPESHKPHSEFIEMLKQNTGSEPLMPNVHPQNWVSIPNQPSYAQVFESPSEDFSRRSFKVTDGPFSRHWVPVVTRS